jgi:hypothetical protein
MGKTNDLGVTTRERAWAEGNRRYEEGKKLAGPMAYRRRFPCPEFTRYMLPNKVNNLASTPVLRGFEVNY